MLINGQRTPHIPLPVFGDTPVIALLESPKPPRSVTLDGQLVNQFEYSSREHLLSIHFGNDLEPQELSVHY
jgi:hypothetical protein